MADRQTDHATLSSEPVFSFTVFPKAKLQTVMSRPLKLTHVLARVMLNYATAKKKKLTLKITGFLRQILI